MMLDIDMGSNPTVTAMKTPERSGVFAYRLATWCIRGAPFHGCLGSWEYWSTVEEIRECGADMDRTMRSGHSERLLLASAGELRRPEIEVDGPVEISVGCSEIRDHARKAEQYPQRLLTRHAHQRMRCMHERRTRAGVITSESPRYGEGILVSSGRQRAAGRGSGHGGRPARSSRRRFRRRGRRAVPR